MALFMTPFCGIDIFNLAAHDIKCSIQPSSSFIYTVALLDRVYPTFHKPRNRVVSNCSAC